MGDFLGSKVDLLANAPQFQIEILQINHRAFPGDLQDSQSPRSTYVDILEDI